MAWTRARPLRSLLFPGWIRQCRYYAHHYNGPVIERVLTLAEAHKACAARGVHADACAWTTNGACHLVIPKNGPVRDRSAYRRHEVAHCNGWDHSHASSNGRDALVEAYR